jgi:hypothetical protein
MTTKINVESMQAPALVDNNNDSVSGVADGGGAAAAGEGKRQISFRRRQRMKQGCAMQIRHHKRK